MAMPQRSWRLPMLLIALASPPASDARSLARCRIARSAVETGTSTDLSCGSETTTVRFSGSRSTVDNVNTRSSTPARFGPRRATYGSVVGSVTSWSRVSRRSSKICSSRTRRTSRSSDSRTPALPILLLLSRLGPVGASSSHGWRDPTRPGVDARGTRGVSAQDDRIRDLALTSPLVWRVTAGWGTRPGGRAAHWGFSARGGGGGGGSGGVPAGEHELCVLALLSPLLGGPGGVGSARRGGGATLGCPRGGGSGSPPPPPRKVFGTPRPPPAVPTTRRWDMAG